MEKEFFEKNRVEIKNAFPTPIIMTLLPNFESINKNLFLLKIKKKIIQKKTKNSVTAIPTIKDRGIIKSNTGKV